MNTAENDDLGPEFNTYVSNFRARVGLIGKVIPCKTF